MYYYLIVEFTQGNWKFVFIHESKNNCIEETKKYRAYKWKIIHIKDEN